MPKPAISVILPFYNAETTLGEAVRSIIRQSWENWELLLFDDGSTDGSPQIAEELAAEDTRIRILTSLHVGLVEALRCCCGAARGDLLARMDADDVAHADRLGAQAAYMHDAPDVALSGTLVRMVGDAIGPGRRRYERWVNNVIHHDEIVRDLFIECPIAHPTFMMRRDAFEEVGGYEDCAWAEDYDLCMRFFVRGARFGKVGQVLLDWRESGGRLSMTDPRYSPEAFRALKRYSLFKTYLAGGRTFYQWGAGEVGKIWLRDWTEDRPVAVVDVNPRKIGRKIHGFDVIAAEELPGPGEAFTLIAVGAPGARTEIREWFSARGYAELSDFLFIA